MSYFDIDALDAKRVYKLLASTVVPRPIAWTVTKDACGRVNAAPFSFFNYFDGVPPVICIGMRNGAEGEKDSLANIRETGDFVVNLVTTELIDAMNVTAVPFPRGTEELHEASLHTVACRKIDLPRIAESPVALECKLWQVVDLGPANHLVIAHVLAVHVDDDAVVDADKCYIDGSKLHMVGRMQSPGWYARTDDRFQLKEMSFGQWEEKKSAARALNDKSRS